VHRFKKETKHFLKKLCRAFPVEAAARGVPQQEGAAWTS